MANWSEYSETCRRMNVSAIEGMEMDLKWAEEAAEEVCYYSEILAKKKAEFEEQTKWLRDRIREKKKEAKKNMEAVEQYAQIAESYHGASVVGQKLAEKEAQGVQ